MECPRCTAPMEEQTLDAHFGRAVAIDICFPCQVLWFDARESISLTPGATLAAAPLDPALPLELARARRDAELAFSNDPQVSTWLRDAPAGDLLGASLIAVAAWLKRRA